MSNILSIFGELVFNEKAMKEYLDDVSFKALEETIKQGKELDISLGHQIAEAMKNWAMSKGATHYSHWFQPLNGITAEKHESFLTFEKGSPITHLSGRELIKGEPDASSFPNGGLRTTFEARGYTAWDPTSYAFIKEHTLCIPTAFCSYGGHALDKKTPLLRSIEALNDASLKILKLFKKDDVKAILTNVGPEQEYFLVDKSLFNKRMDLKLCGRTLFGAKPSKGQELNDHYFGVIKPRVASFMEELDKELWKLGISAKTEHNEVAPSQHELASIYTSCNSACDQNQLVMETMSHVAEKHQFMVLFHEKPYEGVNGSGKHNNWSISTDTGINLLSPGETPFENQLFLLFLLAVIKAVDDYQDLLRISVATASNDHRLGKNEAPPAIISIFLGDELNQVLEAIEKGESSYTYQKSLITLGAHVLPFIYKDNTDRNRTSPFAYTGNKFEFRMLGSSKSISDTNTVLNTAVAESLSLFYERLKDAKDFEKEVHTLIKETLSKHKRIIFNGNGYNQEWVEEAKRRGLSNYATTPEALVHLSDAKNIALFKKHKVLNEEEVLARQEINFENYVKTLEIEIKTMISMSERLLMPSINRYLMQLADQLDKSIKAPTYASRVYEELSIHLNKIETALISLREENEKCFQLGRYDLIALYIKDKIIPIMEEIRKEVDASEVKMPKDMWPLPSYEELLFSED